MTHEHNESIELDENMALVCFKSMDTVHERHNSAFLLSTLAINSAFSAHAQNIMQVQDFNMLHAAALGQVCQCRMQMQRAGLYSVEL